MAMLVDDTDNGELILELNEANVIIDAQANEIAAQDEEISELEARAAEDASTIARLEDELEACLAASDR